MKAPIKLFVDELEAINKAQHDGEGWVLPDGVPANLRERLTMKRMVRYWANRWQLTPAGFARSKMFR
ncbi:hypothetical protein NF699_09495 [Sphingomonadaceae bacterium OTU29LAMAA1]|nr:hypothetical protein NF699_09495 [Sphingomonadaceae bacterium OTU29LAMAA1]